MAKKYCVVTEYKSSGNRVIEDRYNDLNMAMRRAQDIGFRSRFTYAIVVDENDNEVARYSRDLVG